MSIDRLLKLFEDKWESSFKDKWESICTPVILILTCASLLGRLQNYGLILIALSSLLVAGAWVFYVFTQTNPGIVFPEHRFPRFSRKQKYFSFLLLALAATAVVWAFTPPPEIKSHVPHTPVMVSNRTEHDLAINSTGTFYLAVNTNGGRVDTILANGTFRLKTLDRIDQAGQIVVPANKTVDFECELDRPSLYEGFLGQDDVFLRYAIEREGVGSSSSQLIAFKQEALVRAFTHIAFEDTNSTTDSIEVTKVRSIVDQPTSINDFADTAIMLLYWEVTLSNNGTHDSSILDYDVLQISDAAPKSYTGMQQGLFKLKGEQLVAAKLPITILAGHSTTFFIRLGVLMDKTALSMVKSEFDGTPKTASAIIDFLRSRETDIFGNRFTKQESGAYSLPSMDDICEPVFRVTFKTARGKESQAIISWYAYGLFWGQRK